MLIRHGANVNATDLSLNTPLHVAASKSRLEVCSLLISEGTDPYQRNRYSKSAIDVAPSSEIQDKLISKLTSTVIILTNVEFLDLNFNLFA